MGEKLEEKTDWRGEPITDFGGFGLSDLQKQELVSETYWLSRIPGDLVLGGLLPKETCPWDYCHGEAA